MPCGGIYPVEESPGFASRKETRCLMCDGADCELHCEEWDSDLHVRCLGSFLCSEEGQVVLNHGHEIYVREREAKTKSTDPIVLPESKVVMELTLEHSKRLQREAHDYDAKLYDEDPHTP